MKMTVYDGKYTFYPEGRIDTTNAAGIEKELFEAVGSKDADIVIDAEKLEYISSAGLRVLMKLQKAENKQIAIINASRDVYDIFETTGFVDIFNVSKAYRRINVDGCKVIGKGCYGTVYRVDPETIVKVYESPESLFMIENEKRLARIALVAGVPTAISYDIVRVGDSYGSVFELLNAKTFNDLLTEQPENADEIIKQFACFMRMVNDQTVPEGKLSSAKEKCADYLETASRYIDAGLYARLKELLADIPEQHNIIHGDAQMKNVMLRDGEPMLIDMDTLAEGNHIFDLQSIYVTYFAFEEDEPGNSMEFLGVSPELLNRVWTDFIKYYFNTDDEKKTEEIRDKITVVGCIRFLALIDLISDHDSELFRIRVRHTAERLGRLAYKIDSLRIDQYL